MQVGCVIDEPVQVLAAPGARYLIDGTFCEADEPDFAAAVAGAWKRQTRPLCLCRAAQEQASMSSDAGNARISAEHQDPQMYIARFGEGYIVKRMPGTAHLHAPGCYSYEAVDEDDDTAVASRSAIQRNATTGVATLRLDFSLNQQGPRRRGCAAAATQAADVRSRPERMNLDSLLHLLWREAELTRWHPSFEGRRHWGLVRRLLQLAAKDFLVQGQPLADWLYLPEPFRAEQRDEIAARRRASWAMLRPKHPGDQTRRLALLIGELKAIEPMRFGARVMIRHQPDQCFVIDGGLLRRLEHRFGELLMRWSTSTDLRVIMAGTFGLESNGTPALQVVTLMEVGLNWVPVGQALP